jgi:hypothetical protein
MLYFPDTATNNLSDTGIYGANDLPSSMKDSPFYYMTMHETAAARHDGARQLLDANCHGGLS